MWFLKRYEPYDLAVLDGLAEIIIFESEKQLPQGWTGIWYAEK